MPVLLTNEGRLSFHLVLYVIFDCLNWEMGVMKMSGMSFEYSILQIRYGLA